MRSSSRIKDITRLWCPQGQTKVLVCGVLLHHTPGEIKGHEEKQMKTLNNSVCLKTIVQSMGHRSLAEAMSSSSDWKYIHFGGFGWCLCSLCHIFSALSREKKFWTTIKYVIYYNILYFFPQVPVKGSSIETNNVFLIIDYQGILTGHNNDL